MIVNFRQPELQDDHLPELRERAVHVWRQVPGIDFMKLHFVQSLIVE
jgi:hypothetical protein